MTERGKKASSFERQSLVCFYLSSPSPARARFRRMSNVFLYLAGSLPDEISTEVCNCYMDKLHRHKNKNYIISGTAYTLSSSLVRGILTDLWCLVKKFTYDQC